MRRTSRDPATGGNSRSQLARMSRGHGDGSGHLYVLHSFQRALLVRRGPVIWLQCGGSRVIRRMTHECPGSRQPIARALERRLKRVRRLLVSCAPESGADSECGSVARSRWFWSQSLRESHQGKVGGRNARKWCGLAAFATTGGQGRHRLSRLNLLLSGKLADWEWRSHEVPAPLASGATEIGPC